MREDLKDTYKTLSDYDRHYSTVRATGVIFLFGLSFGIASFLLTDSSRLPKDPFIVFIASMIPFFFLVTAFLLSCHFQQLTYACRMYMKGVEKTNDTQTSLGGTLTINVEKSTFDITGWIKRVSHVLVEWPGTPPNEFKSAYTADMAGGSAGYRIDQCRINLGKLVKGRKILKKENGKYCEREAAADLKILLRSLKTKGDKLPCFISFDLPNQILTVAMGLLLFLPCLEHF